MSKLTAQGNNQNYRGQHFRGGYRVTIEMKTLEEVEVGLEKDCIQVILEGITKAILDQSGSRACTNRDRIICFKCGEYDHFTKDCLNSDTEKEQS